LQFPVVRKLAFYFSWPFFLQVNCTCYTNSSKFTQADSSDTRQVGGTGLGLSITKAMVEKHNGRIAFVSELGIGTTFYIDLPELKTSQTTSTLSSTLQQPANLTSRRILICEDKPDIASLLMINAGRIWF